MCAKPKANAQNMIDPSRPKNQIETLGTQATQPNLETAQGTTGTQ